MTDYKNLLIWQKSMDLVMLTYEQTKKFPNEETYALSDQMRRAAVSIPSNIAEGSSRSSDRDFAKFISIASGSAAELETQFYISKKLGYISDPEWSEIVVLLTETRKMLNSFRTRLLAISH